MAKKIILDVDTGSDDAVAIMAASLSPEIQLEAVCSVAGNKDIDKTTENSLRVVQLLGTNTPVYRGNKTPLVKFLCNDRLPIRRIDKKIMQNGKEVQMHSDYLDIPKSKIQEQKTPAPIFYVDYLRNAKEPVTIVAVGPLTNIAMALLIDEHIVNNIAEIIVMGGGYTITNVTPTAEFNIWFDPEAAQIVINSGAKVVFVPLDATHEACITKDDCVRFRGINTISSNFAADLCEQRIIVHNALQPLDIPDAAAVHDSLAVCYAIDPSVLRDVRHVHCDIGLRDFSEGQTIIDPRFYTEEKNCYFAYSGDRFKYVEMLCEIFQQNE
jgi:inosine-uridine nucleoside N-ribohydrolase